MYTVTVPPTAEQGSYKTNATSRADALWFYNSARAHDGLPPVSRLPAGTLCQYQRTTRDEWHIEGNYGQGWEIANVELTRADGRRSLREYDENEPYAHRLVKRRVKIEE